jgi:hypothetical protein
MTASAGGMSGALAGGVQFMYCSHEIRYESLSGTGRSLCFPCDAQGHVPLDQLSESARENYLYARAVVGREYAWPCVCLRATR